ncbi:MAG: hydantoinase/oxoprolinase family protein [Geminicoccaceae bacterium]|nr:hydantoinase/oxoprolinase family protein [Geminicoccaceae bacterium]
MRQAGGTIGVDVGGTFTDLVAIAGSPTRDGSSRLLVAKVPSTPQNQALGVLDAISRAALDLATIETIVHGTTTTTNALLERGIARTGLITTRGFRDILELGRRTRPQPYGMTGVFEPLIPRELRREVEERTDAEGRVVTPLDEDGVRQAAEALIEAGCESVVIHFLHAYARPGHEIRAGEIVRSLWPNAHVTVGHEVLSEFREFERGTTATVNAVVQPVLARYVAHLRDELKRRGFARDLLVMQGNGGTVAAELVAEEAAKTVMSGPASGVMAAAFIGQLAGFPDLITYDMGGTSSDVALIQAGVPAVSDELELEHGMPIHVPMVDVHTIGAGGGSIAFINDGGMLQVGPRSAGAVPGPIAFGRGGSEPTITDANLVLGRLNPEGLLSVDGRAPLERVERAIEEKIGHPLGLDARSAAAAILRIANDRMAGAIRMVSLARGHDPRDYALFAFGGAGPLHASAIARELGIPRVLIPVRPGITNAIGCVVADIRHDLTLTINRTLDNVGDGEIANILDDLESRGRIALGREHVAIDSVQVNFSLDMQFRGQTHVLNVPARPGTLDRTSIRSAFDAAYLDRFGIELPEMTPVIVALKASVVAKRSGVHADLLRDDGDRRRDVADARIGTRRVRFGKDWMETPVYNRRSLPLEAVIAGPAIIEQLDTTIVVEPGDRVESDRFGNLVISVARPRPLA